MTRAAYYRHIRSLGSFPAVEAYRLAGEAAKLDEAHQIKRVKVGKREVSYEVLPDGSGMLRASRSISPTPAAFASAAVDLYNTKHIDQKSDRL